MLKRTSLHDSDSRFGRYIPGRGKPPGCCHKCGQSRLVNHRDLADSTRVVTCLDCGQQIPRTITGGLVAEPLKSLAAIAILGVFA